MANERHSMTITMIWHAKLAQTQCGVTLCTLWAKVKASRPCVVEVGIDQHGLKV